MMHRRWRHDDLLRKYDAAPVGRNDTMFARKHQAKPTPSAPATPFVKQHHLPKANIMQKGRICPSDKCGLFGGHEGDRTLDLTDANRTLSQLSYKPEN